MKDLVYSLSDLLWIIDRWFKELFWGFSFWFKAEISKISKIKWYYYIDLIEFDKFWKIKAKSRWIVFDEIIINSFLKDIQLNSFDDLKSFELMFYWRFNFHSDYWFSIIIADISREYYLWKYKKQVDNIILKLQNLWVYYNNRNKKPWFPPFNIAVISTSWSAWFEDFKSIFANSSFNYSIQLFVAAIHWNEAISQVLLALKQINDLQQRWKVFDFVVITRWWWGSQWILWQNDFEIALSICKCICPVIVAIWHTQDKSILDDIVFYSAKTPSDAAHYLLNYYNYYLWEVNSYYNDIISSWKLKLTYYKDNIELLYSNIISRYNQLLVNYSKDLEMIYSNILSLWPDKIKDKWYWILYSIDWNLLNYWKLKELKNWDKIIIKIYDKSIQVNIDKID